MTTATRRTVIALAAVLGVAYALLTPPFEVPDEVYHFWRPLVIAQGQLMPQRRHAPDAGTIPLGAQNLVFVMSQKTAEGKYTREQMRVARQSPLEPDRPKVVRFPTWYTPVPYAPQTLAGLAMRVFGLRPFVVFYLGRLLNLAAALALMAIALRVAPDFATPLAAVTLLPMTLAQFASWSADALTIAVAVLLTALLLAERAPRATIAVAFVLALCKPAYFLIALLALHTRYRRSVKAAIIGASAAGTLLALAYARLGAYAQRMYDPIDPAAQLRCLMTDPMRFVRAVAHDIPVHGWLYVEQLVGRFGGAVQVGMPLLFIMLEILLLVVVAITRRAKARPTSGLIVVGSVFGIFLSQFLIWSVACGEVLDGVQGRYFLPLLPLALTLPAFARVKVPAPVVIGVAAVCNVAALVGIARYFW
jgi:uncharacterized membrane protein